VLYSVMFAHRTEYLSVYVDCRDDIEVLDANSAHLVLRPSSLPRSILLNADNASPTVADPDVTVAIVFNSTTSLKVRFIQASMWATNVARVTAELRRYDDPRFDAALRVCRHNHCLLLLIKFMLC